MKVSPFTTALVRTTRFFETRWQRFRESNFRRPVFLAALIFPAAVLYIALNKSKTGLTDEEQLDLYLRERTLLRRYTEREMKKLMFKYIQQHKQDHKFKETDLTQQELDFLHEEAMKLAKDKLRQKIAREADELEQSYSTWNSIKRVFGLEEKKSYKKSDIIVSTRDAPSMGLVGEEQTQKQATEDDKIVVVSINDVVGPDIITKSPKKE